MRGRPGESVAMRPRSCWLVPSSPRSAEDTHHKGQPGPTATLTRREFAFCGYAECEFTTGQRWEFGGGGKSSGEGSDHSARALPAEFLRQDRKSKRLNSSH